MEWIEAKIYTTHMGVEPVCAVLMEAGINGVMIEDHEDLKNFLAQKDDSWDYVDEELLNKESGEAVVKFYVVANEFGKDTILAVRNGLRFLEEIGQSDGLELGRLSLEMDNVDDTEWLNNWKKYYKPFHVGKNIVIKPQWEEYENKDGKIIFTINPGHVFGTGLHQTTQLCIGELENYASGKSVLDLGCGTGILSVIALMLGAKDAVAVDIDPNAVDIAYENARNNGVEENSYRVYSGNVLSDAQLREKLLGKQYEVVVANIVADVIIALAPHVSGCVLPGGIFISSGIISERLQEVKETVESNGFEILRCDNKDDWYCVVSVKRN